MPSEPAAPRSRFWTSWGIPILLVLGVAAALALGLKQQTDVSFPLAFGLSLLGLFGLGAYFLGVYQVYESAARRLGWSCETRPQERPKSARHEVDIVIRGVFRGRPFTLYRATTTTSTSHNSSGYYSGLEWTGGEIRLPSFSLRVTRGLGGTLEKVVGAEKMAKSLAGMIGRPQGRPRVEFAAESALSRRSELSAEDAGAARAFFSPTLCDALDPMIRVGTIEGEPGLLVVRGKGFPLPWKLEEFLAHGDEIRRALAG